MDLRFNSVCGVLPSIFTADMGPSFQYTVYVLFRQIYQIRIIDDSRQLPKPSMYYNYKTTRWRRVYVNFKRETPCFSSSPVNFASPNGYSVELRCCSLHRNKDLEFRRTTPFIICIVTMARIRGGWTWSVYLRVFHDSEENDSEYTACHCAS